jgi:hypothetical protein
MKINSEYDQFNAAIDTILRADPKVVKSSIDAEIRATTAERKARGERKRGRKPKSSSASHVSTSKD